MKKRFDVIVVTNNNGGLFVKGKRYSHAKNLEVANKFLNMFVSNLENPPTVKAVAKSAEVSAFFARKIMNKIKYLVILLILPLLKNTKKQKTNVVKVQ